MMEKETTGVVNTNDTGIDHQSNISFTKKDNMAATEAYASRSSSDTPDSDLKPDSDSLRKKDVLVVESIYGLQDIPSSDCETKGYQREQPENKLSSAKDTMPFESPGKMSAPSSHMISREVSGVKQSFVENITQPDSSNSVFDQEFSGTLQQTCSGGFQKPCKSQMSLNPETCSKGSQSSESKTRPLESRIPSSEIPSTTESSQVAEVQSTSQDNLNATGYLDHVISSIQTVSGSPPDGKRDSVQISRQELKFMVEQTLTAQTMSNYMQQLVQKNQVLNKQNEVMKYTLVQMKQREDKAQSQSLPVVQKTDSRVFSFDRYALQPVSLPAYDQSASTSDALPPVSLHAFDQSASTSGVCSGPLSDQSSDLENPDQGYSLQSLPQADSGASMSLTLSSHLSLDGDRSLSAKDVKEASTSWTFPPAASSMTARGTQQPNRNDGKDVSPAWNFPAAAESRTAQRKDAQETSAAWNVPDTAAAPMAALQGPPQLNIPHAGLLEEAQYYSTGPSQSAAVPQHRDQGSASVSPEQFDLLADELEKTKLFVHRISKDGGVHPENLKELAALRDKVEALRKENTQLHQELQNRPSTLVSSHAHDDIVRQLKNQLEKQKNLENQLLMKFAALGAENKKLKSESSQPPSSVGLHALPTISFADKVNVSCQTAAQAEHDYNQKKIDGLTFMLQQARADKETLQRQMREREITYKKALEDAQSQHSRDNEMMSQLRHRLEEKSTHCQELGEQLTGLDRTVDRLKKVQSNEEERCRQLEAMIQDERKRWSRDEKKLLDQVKSDARTMQALEMLVLAMDRSGADGRPLHPKHLELLNSLKEQRQ